MVVFQADVAMVSVFNDVNCRDQALHIAALHMHMVGLQQYSTCSLSCFNPYPT